MRYCLSFTTDSMDVCINNYEKYEFDYAGWIVSDKYEHYEKNPRWSRYTITITSHDIFNEETLNDSRITGQRIVDLITPLLPVCGLPSLNSPKYVDFLKDQSIVDYKSSPQGWSTDYKAVLEQIKKDNGTNSFVNIEFMGVSRYSTIEDSPLMDLQLMLKNYDTLDEEIKFLIFLHYTILTSADINIYMLIGKALEIVNALYPYNRNHGKEDKRIEEFFPELSRLFGNVTIKDLISLSNNRKETRHYINKGGNKPHEPLSSEERKTLYKCSIYLMMNVIRDKFGLPHEEIML